MKIFHYIISLFFQTLILIREFLYTKGVFKKKTYKTYIISIGNLMVGGTGKTPTTAYISHCLQQQNIKHVVVSRGYKKKGRGTFIVQNVNSQHLNDPKTVGDEPVLLSKKLLGVPIVVDSNKQIAIKTAIHKFKPQIVLLDDAFQSHYINKDIDLVLINSSDDLAKYQLLPLGLLREPLSSLRRASLVLFINKNKENPKIKKYIQPFLQQYNIPTMNAITQSQLYQYNPRSKKLTIKKSNTKIKEPVMIVAAIADPKPLIKTIQHICSNIISEYYFHDHFAYNIKNKKVQKLLYDINQYKKHNAQIGIITTLKDYVKIEHLSILKDPVVNIYVLDIDIRIDKEEKFLNYIIPENILNNNQ
tara:strand:+ start:5640 stop:6719 length:1080 start_codon:yes stop_codon:yes gene_type:complete